MFNFAFINLMKTPFLMVQRLAFVLCVLVYKVSFSQSSFVPLNHASEYFLDRVEVKSGRLSNDFHNTNKPFSRQAVSAYVSGLSSEEYYNLSFIDRKNIDFIKADNWEFIDKDSISHPGFLKLFFKKKNDFIHYENEDFDIHASPILGLNIGANSAYGMRNERTVSNNTRGVEIRARINKKLGFYSMFTDNITVPDNYQVNYFQQYHGFPYESFIKIINEDSTQLKVNYFQALGYFTFKPIKSLQLTFGHDKNFVGNGVRSLILSDFSAPYLQLRLDLRLGRFQYQNIFGQMTNKQEEIVQYSQKTNTPKYMAFHHLNVNITKKLNVGIFENVMFGNRKVGFDPNYLNPIIFYRFVEGYLGSSDNAMVGADFRWNVFKTATLYGQFVLDEFHTKEFGKDDWWAKKYAWQLGLKYYDVLGVSNLDLLVEHNRARPYMYSHFTSFTNYVNYNLPIAHPLGANFKENIVTLNYQPTQKLQMRVTGSFAIKGEDQDSLNYGGDIIKMNFLNKPLEYGVKQGQGFENKITFVEARASYMLWHNIYADAIYRMRRDSYASGQENTYSVGLRWNFAYRNYMY
jgi:hypothetical protein